MTLDSTRIVDHFYHTSWTAKDGLPGAALAITQTTDGFLWLGGSSGLFRFDGLVIERYTPQQGSLLHETVIAPLFASSDGGLWIGYFLGGASFLKNGKITNFTEQDGLPAGQTRSFAQDRDGVVWAAFAGGVARFDGTHWQKVGADWNYPEKTASCLVVDRAGTVWVTSADKTFFLPPGERRFQDAGLSVAASMLVVAPDNVLWITEPRENSIVSLRTQEGLLKRGLTKINVSNWSPRFDRNGGLWTGSWGDGVLRFRSPDKLPEGTFSKLSPEAETLTEADGLSDNHATTFFEDREGNIWIGTNAGLDRLRYRNLSWFALQPGVHDFSLIPGADGEIFAASRNGETVRLPQRAPDQRAPRNVLLAHRDSNGVIWMDCFDGDGSTQHSTIFKWTEQQLTKVELPRELAERQLRAMTSDSAGTLWISVNRVGIFKFREGVWTRVEVFKDDPTATASSALTDSRGRIWLAYPQRKQLAVLTGGSVTNLYTEKDVSVGTVNLLVSSGEQIWAAGDSGIAFSQGDEFHTVSADDGSAFADVNVIVPTALDGVWLSAHQGIVHIPAEEIGHVFSDPSYKFKYETFDQLSDLPDRLQAGGGDSSSAVQASDGALWFATRNGVARIDPRNILKNRLAPPVTIRSISADGKDYALEGTTLPPLTKDLRFEYTGLSLAIPERVRFRYKLDGWDRDWQEAGARREAFYTNLAPGNYRFHVTACNNDGVWNDVGAVLDFSVAPAWYQTNWFMLICIFAGLCVLATAYRLRVRQLARAMSARFDERLDERTRVAREIHDTLLQTVQGSKMVADHALKNLADHARMVQAMQQLSTWLQQATEEGRAALHSLRASTVEKNDLAEAFRRAIDECGIASRAEISFSVNGDSRELHPVVRDEIYRIGYEAMRNSCAHSGGDRLEVTLKYSHDLTLRIGDNGVGIDSEVLEKGKEGHFGLRGMRERAERIGSKFTLVSSPDSGTVITLIVPGRIAFRTAPPIGRGV